jgi:N-acetyltransferase 10
MGYGKRALQLLMDFYEGMFTSLSEDAPAVNGENDAIVRVTDAELASSTLLDDDIKVRDIHNMPPLFSKLSERAPIHLDYIGVSYGLTSPLHKFWKRSSFVPVYLRQTANDLTGEHTCIMLRTLSTDSSRDNTWLGAYARDFHKRFLSLLSYQFRTFPSITALSIDESASQGFSLDASTSSSLTKQELDALFSPFDLKRLESYANNMLDYHVILDLLPTLASLYFTGKLKPAIKLTGVQSSILLAIGLQRKDLSDVESELSLPSSQLLAMFVKIIRKLSSHFSTLVSQNIEETLPSREKVGVSLQNAAGVHEDEHIDERFAPLDQNLEDELEEGGDEAMKALKERQRELINALPLDQ